MGGIGGNYVIQKNGKVKRMPDERWIFTDDEKKPQNKSSKTPAKIKPKAAKKK